ncbi:AAA domain-containing protein [Marinoscillum sp. MHG1-6]|uniref:AAA domain-containing protein n=1 Tax=Marinoscillum sp. MHG1-6 TaxID=2959627 RepID=UPI002157A383|nr:AAA domain-containing protein [Marinoscillum sp. MHG1-6]
MEKVLQSYLRRLTNLSSNNRSLLFLRLISDQSIDLHAFDHAINDVSFNIIEQLIAKKRSIPLVQQIDTHDGSGNQLAERLKKIDRIEKFIFQERGARDLYVGWPFIRGKFVDDTLVRAPLIFFPVTLSLSKNQWSLQLRDQVNITFNKTFLLAYAHYNQVPVDEELVETILSDLDDDATVFRTKLYQILKQSQLEINFNQDNFVDKLSSFRNYKKAELNKEEKTGKLKLYPEAVLGIFPQAGSYLVPDYLKLLASPVEQSLADFFTSRRKENPEAESKTKFSDKVKEENTFTPFDCDASQERALRLVKNGNSMVIQGPPGTGKSQLICNLISDYIARGKNVLLISQKKAALDVVFNRLKSKELHDFVGLVHDFKNDRKSIFDQVARQIDNIDAYKQKNNGLDAIYLERTFQQSSRKIDQTVEELDEYKRALFDEAESGKSIKELYLISDPNEQHISLNQDYRQFHYQEVPGIIQKFRQYLDYHTKFSDHSFFNNRPNYSHFTAGDLSKIKDIITQAGDFQEKLKKESASFLTSPMDYETCLHFLTQRENLEQLITNLDNETVFKYFQLMQEHETERPPWLTDQERIMMNCFKGSGVETSLPARDLGRFQESLEHAIKARKNIFSWVKWKLFSKDKIFITRILITNRLKSDRQGFEVLLDRIDNRLNFEHLFSEIQERKWLIDFPKSFRIIDIQNWFFYQKLAFRSNDIAHGIRTLSDFAPSKEHARASYVSLLKKLGNFLDQVPTQQKLWSRYLNEKQIRQLMLGKVSAQEINKELTSSFDSLVEYDKIKSSMSSSEIKIIENLISTCEGPEEIIEVLQNSIALAWIDHIEAKFPILRAVSSLKMNHLSQELQESVREKKEVSEEILLLKARERTYHEVEFNRQNNMVTYRELYHQVTKKRKVWPIRKVIHEYKEELFALLPCWMASPESASAIFPMEEIFDIIIFDEASQCFAERGIPGMYRGKQVVIAGDDKQLQPNDLYRVRWEDEDLIELEVDSLLSLGKQYLPEVSLQGHYRSKSLELIAFSNEHFYNNKLKVLPDYRHVAEMKNPIHFIKVNGTWEDSINREEASTVVKLVQRILKENPQKEIGVVTFNVSQQSHILDLLDDLQANEEFTLPDTFFVKNIENVQGDEKDVIIFTTAYGHDKDGKLQLKFGSLNQAGGENRLNVAVSRAREEIYLVTSLMPSEMKTEGTKNQGPKLLRAYLDFAHDVSEGKWKPAPNHGDTHNPEWYLKKKLEKVDTASQLKSELPFADLTAKNEGHYQGLVLTDDDLFYETLSSKDAYCDRMDQFTEKHWPFVQFYSREYWLDKAHAEEKLRKFVIRTSS